MSYIKFNDSATKFTEYEIKILDQHTIKIKGIPQDLSGFKLYNDIDRMFGDYSTFTYDYKQPNLGVNEYIYTDDAHIFYYTVSFVISQGLDYEGTLIQYAIDYSAIITPNITTQDNYNFIGWDKQIPTSGDIGENVVFTAVSEYIPILSEVQSAKIKEFSNLCGSVIESGQKITLADGTSDTFNYSSYNQMNITNAFNVGLLAYKNTGTKMNVPLYDANNVCKNYSFDDIATIYVSMQGYVTYNLTLDHQLEAQIKLMTDKDVIKALTYSVESLDATHKSAFDDIIAQTKNLVNAVIGK